MDVTFRARIVSLLAQNPPPATSPGLKPAGVLIPIVTRGEPSVLFTVRSAHMTAHAGQVCFPGGRFHEKDESLTESALREAEEEIGIPRELIQIAGFLDTYQTITGYTVLPVVGFVRPGFSLNPNSNEVADIFEVPLRFLLDSAKWEARSVERDGKVRQTYVIAYGEHRIWGATAGIIVNLSEKLNRP